MKFIIMAGGTYLKFDTPKHLLPITGEPIICRTIRLLREQGVQDIAISTNDNRFKGLGVPLIHHTNDIVIKGEILSGCWVTAFCPLDEPACYIMGDVVFSPEAIRTIVDTPTDSITFFAACPPLSPAFIKEWGEPFAFKVVDQKRFRAAIDFVKANQNTGIFRRNPIAWELWQVIIGHDVKRIDYDTITAINDYSCDVDAPEDIEKIERMMSR